MKQHNKRHVSGCVAYLMQHGCFRRVKYVGIGRRKPELASNSIRKTVLIGLIDPIGVEKDVLFYNRLEVVRVECDELRRSRRPPPIIHLRSRWTAHGKGTAFALQLQYRVTVFYRQILNCVLPVDIWFLICGVRFNVIGVTKNLLESKSKF